MSLPSDRMVAHMKRERAEAHLRGGNPDDARWRGVLETFFEVHGNACDECFSAGQWKRVRASELLISREGYAYVCMDCHAARLAARENECGCCGLMVPPDERWCNGKCTKAECAKHVEVA